MTDNAAASHLPAVAPAVSRETAAAAAPVIEEVAALPGDPVWTEEGERELKKIPFFVRGKARRNTEKFALQMGLTRISVDTLYEAKSHYAR